MNTTILKKQVLELINNIEQKDTQLLKDCYALLKRRTSTKEGALWEQLTTSEKRSLLDALEESKDLDQLISHDDIKQKHQEWL